MKVKIIVCGNNHVNEQLEKALSLISQKQDYFKYSVTRNNNRMFSYSINWYSFVKENKEHYSNGHYMFITDVPFDDNWFSHVNEHMCVITTYGWEEDFAPPQLYVFLMYEIMECSINFEIKLSEDNGIKRISHKNSVGCLFDFCRRKEEIKIGMKTGCICSDCKATLEAYGMNYKGIEAVEAILDTVRNHAINRKPDGSRPRNNQITILFLAANPQNTTQLRLDEEAREIYRRIRLANRRDNLRFITWWAVQPSDILQAVNETHPTIIHFSGHGIDTGKLVLEPV